MVTIRLARHGAKSVRSYQLLLPTAVMHATVVSSSALASLTQSLAKRRRHSPDLDRIAHWVGEARLFRSRSYADQKQQNKAA